MLYLIITQVVVFLLALGACYLITRPIGDARRYISATLISRAPLGTFDERVCTCLSLWLARSSSPHR